MLLISDGLEDRVVDVLKMNGYDEREAAASRYRVFRRRASNLPGAR
jgi:hypothetical protein